MVAGSLFPRFSVSGGRLLASVRHSDLHSLLRELREPLLSLLVLAHDLCVLAGCLGQKPFQLGVSDLWSSLVILPRVIPPDRPLRGGQRERPSEVRSALLLSVNERDPAFCGASLGSIVGVLAPLFLGYFHPVGAAFAGNVRRYLYEVISCARRRVCDFGVESLTPVVVAGDSIV